MATKTSRVTTRKRTAVGADGHWTGDVGAFVDWCIAATDLETFKAALAGVTAEEAFVTAISPSNLELYYENRHYNSDEEYLEALGEAMRVEYRHRRGRFPAADRRSPHGDALQPGGRGNDRGLPQVHRGPDRGAELRLARHPRGQNPLPHLL